jgi:molybdopterin-guanine dinucleotide biosynthesis protein A
LNRSAIVLAGGLSSRLGQDKGLQLLANKPLVMYVLDTIKSLADETFVVVSSRLQAKNYEDIVDSDTRVVIDSSDIRCPLVGASTGFESVHGSYSVVLSGDTPFVSRNVLSLMFELSVGKSAAIPRWPEGFIEPLQAVYRTEPARLAAKEALNERKLRMQAMVDKLQGVRFVSTLVLCQLDRELRTFFNVNTFSDLRKAEIMLRRSEARFTKPSA